MPLSQTRTPRSARWSRTGHMWTVTTHRLRR